MYNMDLKIFGAIDRYVGRVKARFHTPGHKGALSTYDITEIDGEFPGEAVIAAQNDAAEFFGSKFCRFLTGGSSMGVKAAVLAVGGDILVPQDRHRCFDEACELARVNLREYRRPQKNGAFMSPDAEDIKQALRRYPRVKAVAVTSPDYYGITVKEEVIDEIKSAGKLLIADSAHGAHFPASELFPRSLSEVADFCNLSGHKTLPCYTQSAYLAVNNEAYIAKIDRALELLGTTSPSYLLLSGLEYGVAFAKEHAADYDLLKQRIDELKKVVPTLENDDFTRLVVDTGDKNAGEKLYFLLKNRGIVAEKYDERFVVFIITVCDPPEAVVALKNELVAAMNLL